eukprot:4040071-Alexandrium_andersonii.AAC.1
MAPSAARNRRKLEPPDTETRRLRRSPTSSHGQCRLAGWACLGPLPPRTGFEPATLEFGM